MEISDRLKVIAAKNIFRMKEKHERQLEREIRDLEIKYQKIMKPLYDSANEILSGERLPKEDELKSLEAYCTPTEIEHKSDKLQPGKIKDFWLRAIKNCEEILGEIYEVDEPVLSSLTNIELKYIEDSFDYELIFYFAPNDYFTNETLTKHMRMKEPGTPLKADGTTILWKPGKNVTRKTIKKKSKAGKKKKGQITEKEVDQESFFHFFKKSGSGEETDSEEKENLDDMMMNRFDVDVELAEAFKDYLIPNAVDYYLNLIQHEEGDFEVDEEDEYEDVDDAEDN